MPLTNGIGLLLRAQREGYALGGFNVHNMEMLQAAVEAAELERSPLILQFNPANVQHAGLAYAAAMAKAAAEAATVPVVLHLDHGVDFGQTVQAIQHGFTSVMYDGTPYPLGANIAVTQRVCEAAHAAGLCVEGEIGQMGGQEEGVFTAEGAGTMSNPEEAATYVAETQVDTLAVAVGNIHGLRATAPTLHLDRLEAIRRRVTVPLVIHGGSGVPDDLVKQAIGLGVCKFNVATQLNQAFLAGFRQVLVERPDEANPRAALARARDHVREAVREKLRVFGSAGRV
ncbi:MAG: ketose-bisphosphate aldolase [Dehalococcoidia bacterium]|nr:ketose-bisphosphate aldolase [Dehalococcoidia bacterium]